MIYMDKYLKRFNKYFYSLIILITVVGALCVAFTYGIGINSFDKHDFLEDIIFANSSLNCGRILSDTYQFNYRIPFGGNLIMMPFILLFGPNNLANQLGALFIVIITVYCLYKLGKTLYDDQRKVLLFTTISLLFVFTYIGEQFIHHAIYYNICFVSLIGELAALINLDKEYSKSNLVFFICWFIYGAINGPIPMILANATVLGSYVLFNMLNRKEENLISYIKNKKVILGTTCSIIGYILFKISIIGTLETSGIQDRFVFTSINTIFKNLTINFFNDYLANFYVFLSDLNIVSVSGIGMIVQLLFALIVLIQPIITIFNFKKYTKLQKYITICLVFVCIICMGMYSITTISNSRYLFNITTSFLMMFAFNYDYLDNSRLNAFYKLSILGLAVLLLFRNTYTYIKGNNEYKKDLEIIKTLENNDLSIGFAKYSNPYYVLSNGEIKFINILVNESISVYNVNETSFFDDNDSYDKFFIMIDQDEFNDLNTEARDFLINNYLETLEVNNYIIYIFDIKNWQAVFGL